MIPNRRAVIGGALALAACDRSADARVSLDAIPGFKHVAPFPVGTCMQVAQIGDPDWVRLAVANCSQVTPEWEMKMEYIVQDDGSFLFDRPDKIAAFARGNGMGLYGTTLVWYAQKPDGFAKLDESRAPFGKAYDNYIAAVVGRYKGAVGWDVVNEAVAEDGNGWRESLWASKLGAFDHMVRAFKVAKEADPDAVLFLNDYNLEYLPRKLDTFQKLVDRLLKAGAPISGIGCQSHLAADLKSGSTDKTLQALARFGLPIHVSELEVSIVRSERKFKSADDAAKAQADVYAEAAQAFRALPTAQQFAFTIWGLRDRDSWLKNENATDTPLPFDDQGQPKFAAAALATTLSGGLYEKASAAL